MADDATKPAKRGRGRPVGSVRKKPVEAGARRPGRPVGSVGRRTVEVEERLAKLRCDPITGMARIAMDKKAPIELRGRMYAELAQYIAPKRRAVDHSGAIGIVEDVLLEIGNGLS